MARFLMIAASSDIGQSTVRMLRDQGHEVITTARNTNKIQPDYILDATDFQAVETVFQQCGPIDGVVNFCGSLCLKPAHLTSYDQYHDVIQSSLTTSFATIRTAGKYMTSGGSVVLISSAAAMAGLSNHEAIAAAKAGVIGLTLSSAATYASSNIRVNAVAPGLVQTSLTESIVKNEMSRKYSESMHALGRLGSPDDVARAVVFLLNPDNAWITGQIIGVDGGLSHIRPKAKA